MMSKHAGRRRPLKVCNLVAQVGVLLEPKALAFILVVMPITAPAYTQERHIMDMLRVVEI